MRRTILLTPLLLIMLEGCLAKTAFDVATAPVRVASAAVDATTTSQSEADEKRGREIHRREEQLAKLEREHSKLSEKCTGGDEKACRERDAVSAEIEALLPTIPYEPQRN